MVWYDANRIERTVTRQFVCSHLLPDEIARLDRPLAFGGGLTDGTYWEWIDEKAKRLFLILVDLHVPDQIFGVIDDSWDDEDLPIAREHVERLALTPARDDRFDRKFYQRQFHYLLRPLERGDQVVVYEDMEVVPLDVSDRRPGGGGGGGGGGADDDGEGGSPGGSSSAAATAIGGGTSLVPGVPSSLPGGGDRAVLPNYPGMVFSRRRIPLAPVAGSAYGSGHVTLEEFQHEVHRIRAVQNDHLVSFWAAYVHQGYGYVLFTPAADGSLKSLLATTPAPVKSLAKRDRRRLVFDWIHCLVDTLCFVHNRGLSHGNIKPSTVLFHYRNGAHHVFFSDVARFGRDAGAHHHHHSSEDKASFDKESYDYAAPEQWYRPSGGGGSSRDAGGGLGGLAMGGGSAASSGAGSSRKSTLTGGEGGSGGRGAGMSMYAGSVHGSISGGGGGGGGALSISPEAATTTTTTTTGGLFHSGSASSGFSISRTSSNTCVDSSHYTSAGVAIPQLNPQAADVFSLGCIILELLGFVLKRPTRSFAAHRAAKHKTPGRGGAVLDSSFHKNLGQVESWMALLAKDAAASLKKRSKDKDRDEADTTLAGVAPMLHVVERMLALHASERPSAYDVQTRMYQILREHCGIAEPHCVHEYGGFDLGWADAAATAATAAYGGGYAAAGAGSGYYSAAGSYTGSSYTGGAASASASASSAYGSYSSYAHAGGPPLPRLVTSHGSTAASSRAVSPTAGGASWSSSSGGLASPSGSSSYYYPTYQPQYHRPKGQRTAAAAAAAAAHGHGHGHGHGRSDSGGSSARSSTVNGGGGGGQGAIPEEADDGFSGLQAIRNLQIRDKVRQSWNAPVYAA